MRQLFSSGLAIFAFMFTIALHRVSTAETPYCKTVLAKTTIEEKLQSLAEFPKTINEIQRARKTIREKNFNGANLDSLIDANISNPLHRNTLKQSRVYLLDSTAWADYVAHLMAETALAMKKNGKTDELQIGKLPAEEIKKTLEGRAKSYGFPVHKFNQSLDSLAFGKLLAKHVFLYDEAFASGSHGAMTHWIQFDFLFPYWVSQLGTPKKVQEMLSEFPESYQKMRVYDKIFDGFDGTPSHPEFFKPFLQNFIEITKQKTRSLSRSAVLKTAE